jgi:hypothetical protein
VDVIWGGCHHSPPPLVPLCPGYAESFEVLVWVFGMATSLSTCSLVPSEVRGNPALCETVGTVSTFPASPSHLLPCPESSQGSCWHPQLPREDQGQRGEASARFGGRVNLGERCTNDRAVWFFSSSKPCSRNFPDLRICFYVKSL